MLDYGQPQADSPGTAHDRFCTDKHVIAADVHDPGRFIVLRDRPTSRGDPLRI